MLRLDVATAMAPLCAAGRAPDATLARIVGTFVHGYNAALRERDLGALSRELDGTAARWRGFAFEGAGMALGMLEELPLGARGAWGPFVSEHAARHDYLIHVGLGWAWARLGRSIEPRLASIDRELAWLAIDGYGFHEGFFRAERFCVQRARPRRWKGYALRAFDQGLGRCLWFVAGADIERAARAVEAFDPDRRADLWSGLGLAVAYAGGTTTESAAALATRAGGCRADFAQGVAFALEARTRGNTPFEHTAEVAELVWGLPRAEIVARVDECRSAARCTAGLAMYEVWRRALRASYTPDGAPRVAVL